MGPGPACSQTSAHFMQIRDLLGLDRRFASQQCLPRLPATAAGDDSSCSAPDRVWHALAGNLASRYAPWSTGGELRTDVAASDGRGRGWVPTPHDTCDRRSDRVPTPPASWFYFIHASPSAV
jgi:hypothetical protein